MSAGRKGFVECGSLFLRDRYARITSPPKKAASWLLFFIARPGAYLALRTRNSGAYDAACVGLVACAPHLFRHSARLLLPVRSAGNVRACREGCRTCNCLIHEQFCPFFHQLSEIFPNVFVGLRNCSQTYCVLEIRLLEFVQQRKITTICSVFAVYFFDGVLSGRGRPCR